jgi:hypothetical protein
VRLTLTSNNADQIFYSCSAGATALETTTRVSNEAKIRAQKELEGRTGETDSEADDSD